MPEVQADHAVVENIPALTQDDHTNANNLLSADPDGKIESDRSSSKEIETTATSQLDWRFWSIFAGLAISALLSALEGSVISTALPTIAADLGSGGNYVWVINLYFLTR